MSDTKLSNLSASGAVAATDIFYSVVTAGTGGVYATAAQLKTFMSASPTLVTPAIGVATGTSLALGGATIGTNALAVNGTTQTAALSTSGTFTATSNMELANSSFAMNSGNGNFVFWNNALVGWSSTGSVIHSSSIVTGFTQLAAANIRFGLAPSATPIAQLFTLGEASRPGTDSDVGGANGTVQSGLGTGIGTLSSLILQSAKASVSGSGTTTQTYVTGMAIKAGTAVLTSYTVANLPTAATAGAGATAFVTDASTTLILGLGGTVTGGGANKVPVYTDGTNWIYG